MQKVGIICEYNPLHNGHIYHLKKIKEMYPDSLIVLVLNGYFLERGEISIETKEDKTKLALKYGVDIVIELPFVFGTQSADSFAMYAVKALNNFGVDKIIFGSESNDINKIIEIAKKQMDKDFDSKVKLLLNEGLNYPTALSKALETDFTFAPNDLLGISYVKAIIKNNYKITPETIKRTNDYHDTLSNNKIISAANIREKLKNNIDITSYIPNNSKNFIKNPNEEIFFKLLKAKILTDNKIDTYLDVDEGIEYRLKEKIIDAQNIEDFIDNVKTKRYTYNKIKRMIIHILIGLKKDDNNLKIDYIKVLGFNNLGQDYLKEIKNKLNIPINIDKESSIYKYELKASLIYDLINYTNTYEFEKSGKPIIY